MEATKTTPYVPSWLAGTRVRLTRQGHPDFLQTASVIAALPNPSERQQNQWYDVRFDSGRSGRFLERNLERAVTDTNTA